MSNIRNTKNISNIDIFDDVENRLFCYSVSYSISSYLGHGILYHTYTIQTLIIYYYNTCNTNNNLFCLRMQNNSNYNVHWQFCVIFELM